jgi:hypothetical protein
MTRCVSTLAIGFIASACASIAHPDSPARIVQPDANSRAELHHAIARALQRSHVTLADDALTRTSILIIERTPARDPTGQRLSGRDYDKPEQFQLVLDGGRCILIHQRTGERYELRATRCEPEGA